LRKGDDGLAKDKDSVTLCRQVRIVDRLRMSKKLGILSSEALGAVHPSPAENTRPERLRKTLVPWLWIFARESGRLCGLPRSPLRPPLVARPALRVAAAGPLLRDDVISGGGPRRIHETVVSYTASDHLDRHWKRCLGRTRRSK
jgi:hypothetical protein